MSSPGEYYRSLPPVCKTYGVICLLTSLAYYLQLFQPSVIGLSYELVLKKFQGIRSGLYGAVSLSIFQVSMPLYRVWRLLTNFFFIAPFSFRFAVRFIMLARYGVLLEKGAFDKRTADFLWMLIVGALSLLVIVAFRPFSSPLLATSLIFMIVYVWSRENPNAQVSFYGVVTFRGFYIPWVFLGLDLIFGNPVKPDFLGIAAGHLYYFLSVLYPLSTGRNILKTPQWVHRLVVSWGKGTQVNSPVPLPNPHAGVAFRGRSYRLNQ